MLGPLQLGLPGVTELFVVLLVLLVLVVPIVVAVGLVMLLLRWRSGDDTDDRVAQLEAEVDRLRDQLGRSGTPSETADRSDDDDDRED